VDNVKERVTSLEGRMLEQSMRIDDVRDALTSLEARIDQRFGLIDRRFLAIDGRLDRMSSQLSNLIIGVAVAAISGVLGMITAMIR